MLVYHYELCTISTYRVGEGFCLESLKAFIPVLGDVLGMSNAALYERQRALVRAKLLDRPQRPGRNSGGSLATPDSVGIMLIAVLATDNLSEVDQRAVVLARQRARKPGSGEISLCGLTGKSTFREALEAILAEPGKAREVVVEVTRHDRKPFATLTSKWTNSGWSEFGTTTDREPIIRKAVFQNFYPLALKLEEISK
jgi:hypothetical protein